MFQEICVAFADINVYSETENANILLALNFDNSRLGYTISYYLHEGKRTP
jgi:hypothetical protein